jgi:hypothetical protein
MTDEQINTAIAEACGWRKEDGVYMWTANGIDYTCPDLWDWTNDLNAMHEAEKVLDIKQVELFADIMYNLCVEGKVTTPNRLGWRFALLNAPARQRAEAFLRTLGKWEEAK